MYPLHSTKRPWLRSLKIAMLSLLVYGLPNATQAQCGFAAGMGCPGTNYANFGFNSDNNAATIEYDNYVSAHGQTVARTSSGIFKIWGENTANNGTSSVLSPQDINVTNYPALTGTVLKATIGSNGPGEHQTIVLTTTGLFVGGTVGTVVSSDITNTTTFTKVTINNITTGLPLGVKPGDVKMLFATPNTLVILTCGGDVWILSQISAMRGNNSAGNPRAWYPVAQNAPGYPRLSNIIAVRGTAVGLVALRNDNTLWTWGSSTYLGDGSPAARRETATQMDLPIVGNIKMIGASSDNRYQSYYVLYIHGALYAVGDNTKRQLGDWTTTERRTWIQPRYDSPSGPFMDNIKWISPREHDWTEPGINVINASMNLYNWGYEQNHSLGRGNVAVKAVNPGMPAGITNADEILSVTTGGDFTLMTRKCTDNFGFVGHRAHGSAGDGSSADDFITTVSFSTAALAVCGVSQIPAIAAFGLTPAGAACVDSMLTLAPAPAGGVLSVVSGPGTLSGNQLTFSTPGNVVVQYEVFTACGNKTVTRSFNVGACAAYKVSGQVWVDESEDGIKDAGEPGSNAGSGPNKYAWANLVAMDGRVVHSVPVAPDGTYQLLTMVTSLYSIQLTGEEIAVGSFIPEALRPLPGGWKYVSRNDGSACALPSCTNPDIISNVVLDASTPVVYNMDFGIKQPPLMPVELMAFTVKKYKGTAVLSWMTAMELDNDGFEIEKSSDGNAWEKIGFVATLAANKNSDKKLTYSFTDQSPASGTNYYRLRQISIHKSANYSNIISVQFLDEVGVYMVAPNPTRGSVQIKGLAGTETIRVIDFSGRLVKSLKVTSPTETIDLSRYSSGLYQLIITDVRGAIQTFKISKRD